MWVEWVEPLKLDGRDRGASFDGRDGIALLDEVDEQFFAMTYLSFLTNNVILNVVKDLSVCTTG